jgi:hypothetical protein
VVNGNWEKDLNGLTFRNCADCKLGGFLVKSVWKKPAALSMENCDRCTVTDVSVLDSDGIGFWMKDCARCRVSDCVVRDDRAGEQKRGTLSLKVEGGADNWVKGNLFSNGVEVSKGSAILEGNRE